MVVITCTHEEAHKHGKNRRGDQRWLCALCGKTFVLESVRPIGDMRIDLADAIRALGMLLEGLSIRAVERLTGITRNTICDLILVVGENCQQLLDTKVRAVEVKDVQVDELWSFIGLKEKNRLMSGYSKDFGDSWTFIALDRNTKLVLAHQVGQRDQATCWEFLGRLKQAVGSRFQLSTDGLNSYTLNVPFKFGNQVDFAQLIKTYTSTQQVTRYSPAQIISAEKRPQWGNPDPDLICTSHIERLNLTMRMNLRRFTRLTNGHSKSPAHHKAMQAILFAWYNFVRVHSTIKTTPAMAAGIADRAWTLQELLERAAQ